MGTAFRQYGHAYTFLTVLAASLMIAAGFLYRLAAVVFFLGFTYIELIDVTTYLNHYYFISLVAFILIWLPANRRYAVDVWLKPGSRRTEAPAWCAGILIFQVSVVYIFAGLAKVNSDWLLDAQPHAYLAAGQNASAAGRQVYVRTMGRLSFFMVRRGVRPVHCFFPAEQAYKALRLRSGADLSHRYGGLLSRHRYVPYVMMTASLIFSRDVFAERLLGYLPGYPLNETEGNDVYKYTRQKIFLAGIGVYVILQVLIRFVFSCTPAICSGMRRDTVSPGRVMLMEKAGTAYFTVKDQQHREQYTVNNAEFLTPLQEKMMSTQPDMILKYAASPCS